MLSGECTSKECHQATGQADYNKAWDKQFQDAKASPGPIPDGFFSGSLSEAQMQCVTNCQVCQKAPTRFRVLSDAPPSRAERPAAGAGQ